VCLAELIQGLEARDSTSYWRRYRDLLENRYPVIPFDQADAEIFGKLSGNFRKKGKTRPALDLMIACCAIRHDLILATLNAKDFIGIPGLTVEDWSDP